MNNKSTVVVLILIILLGGFLYSRKVNTQKVDNQIITASSTITFPQGGEELKQGEVYTLSWTGGPDPTQIFLVNRSLKDQGASVSISDRVYGITNTHSYNYTVSTSTEPGEYEFQIGDTTSAPFTIVSQ